MFKDILCYKPIAISICRKINFISRISLCKVYPWLTAKLSIKLINFRFIVKNNLIKIIQNSGDSYEKIILAELIAEELLNAMETTKTFLSGSFLLKCLTEFCDNSVGVGDLDFFTNNYHEIYTSKLYKRRKIDNNHHQPLTIPFVSKFTNFLYMSPINVFDGDTTLNRVIHSGSESEDTGGPDKQVLNVRNFYINQLKVQDIVIKHFTVKQYICHTFDMDFLKNIFDGKTLHIYNPTSILKRKATVNIFESYFKSFMLLREYQGGGGWDDDVKYNYIKRQYKRHEKYENRGFKIDVDYSKNIDTVENFYKQICGKKLFTHSDSDSDSFISMWDTVNNSPKK